jgi:hypothetical protein
MGEIDDTDHTKDYGQPKRHEAIDQAGQDPGNGDIQINIKRHRSLPRSASRAILVRLYRPFELGIRGLFGCDRYLLAVAVLDSAAL